uniref:Nuclear pore protein n=1 Tax=Clastoptera arizonana TaxID=38151 RepID=A0A1B6C656_9HEMI
MAFPDFEHLLNDVEQFTSNIETFGDLSRIERTPRQVLEASEELWTRITAVGAQETHANLLLGSKGVDLPQLSQKLDSLNADKQEEQGNTILDKDISSFVRNDVVSVVKGVFHFSHNTTQEDFNHDCYENILQDWKEFKLKNINSMLDIKGENILKVPHAEQKIKKNEKNLDTRSFFNQIEIDYAQAVIDYHQSIINDSKPNIIDKFYKVARTSKDKVATEIWAIVRHMTQIPLPIDSDDPIEGRNKLEVKQKFIKQAKHYLENRYRLYMKKLVKSSTGYVHVKEKPNNLLLVKQFVNLKITNNILGLDPLKIGDQPLWPVAYYCLRSGDLQLALQCVKQAGPDCEEICKALEELKGTVSQTVSLKRQKLIRNHCNRNLRNNTDPYKRLMFCILGDYDLKDEHSEVIVTADDYLWLKLSLIFEEGQKEKTEHLHYSDIQKLILFKYGGNDFKKTTRPFIYFQLLFLTGQWEAAIDFLIRKDNFRVHGIHLAIALYEVDLLGMPRSISAPTLTLDKDDPIPMLRLNFVSLIKFYIRRFDNHHVFETLNYYFCLRKFNDIQGDNVFASCVVDYLIRTRRFNTVLGHLQANGTRSLGLIDRFQASKENLNILIKRLANTLDFAGEHEDAVVLYHLAGEYNCVIRLLNSTMSQIIAKFDGKLNILQPKLIAYTDNILKSESIFKEKCDKEPLDTFYKLLGIMKFLESYSLGHHTDALNVHILVI